MKIGSFFCVPESVAATSAEPERTTGFIDEGKPFLTTFPFYHLKTICIFYF